MIEYVAKMAVVHTQAYARKVVEGRKQNAINMMTQELLKYISQSGIKFELRQHVAATIQYIMSQDRNQIILTAFIPNFIDLLKQAINQPDNNINF